MALPPYPDAGVPSPLPEQEEPAACIRLTLACFTVSVIAAYLPGLLLIALLPPSANWPLVFIATPVIAFIVGGGLVTNWLLPSALPIGVYLIAFNFHTSKAAWIIMPVCLFFSSLGQAFLILGFVH